jgi:calcineurin-like phosphoesterase
MLAVAFIGVIMHELTSGQVQALVTAAKKAAGQNVVLVCNASGLFASAPRLGRQLELLFDSEIDLIFAGEQAIARNAGRNELQVGQRSILRPENFSLGAPGIGTKMLVAGQEKIWMICLADQSFRTPLEHAHEVLEDFLRNKKDTFPVFINVNGKDPDYKKALFWKYAKDNGSVTIVGSGMNFCTGKAQISPTGSAFQADAGVVASEDAIAGMAPELWWKKNIGRLPVAALPGNSRIEADISLFFYENGRVVKTLAEKLLV